MANPRVLPLRKITADSHPWRSILKSKNPNDTQKKRPLFVMRRFIRKDEDTKVVSKEGGNIVGKPDYRVSLQKFEEQLKNR